jgi:hypothetical protein
MMQGDGQFDNAEARAQMAAGGGHGVDRLQPKFVGQLTQFADV